MTLSEDDRPKMTLSGITSMILKTELDVSRSGKSWANNEVTISYSSHSNFDIRAGVYHLTV